MEISPRLRGRSPHGERGLKYGPDRSGLDPAGSLSSWRAWIEIRRFVRAGRVHLRRSPHGERGLKFRRWSSQSDPDRRSPHGERGLKLTHCTLITGASSRSPHGERGLKSEVGEVNAFVSRSLSSWRAWIEISDVTRTAPDTGRSLSSWRAWIEIARRPASMPSNRRSLSSWRAWIEINKLNNDNTNASVALLMESVD